MRNISSILTTHIKNILNPKQTSFGWNCRNKDNCPLDSECLTPNIIYHSDIATDNDYKFDNKFFIVHQKQHSNITQEIILVNLNMSNTNILVNLLNTSSS